MSASSRVQLPARPPAQAPGPQSWSALSIWLHWLIVLLIVVQFIDHEWMEAMWDAFRDNQTPSSSTVSGGWLHIVAGSVILVSALLRLWDRYTHGRPPYPENDPTWALWLAKITHFLIYTILILMPVSGLVAWFGGIRIAGYVHGLYWNPLLVLIGLHVLGALVQALWFKSDVLKRIVRAG